LPAEISRRLIQGIKITDYLKIVINALKLVMKRRINKIFLQLEIISKQADEKKSLQNCIPVICSF
jgi:23S rRNA C2498 (ribose-2'-O)-methylase RlmM